MFSLAFLQTALLYLGYILIFPGFLFCFVVGLLLCGIDRKVVARMQKRVGPPVLQPFYDFFKLCGKETIVPAAASRTTFMLAPLVGLAALVVIQLFIPVFNFRVFRNLPEVADIIVILYLLLIPAVSVMMGGAATGSPYAGVGLSREMVTVLAVELPLVIVLLSVAKAVGNDVGKGLVFSLSSIVDYQAAHGSLIGQISMLPAALAMLLIIPGETGNHPFDAAEAETEICEGLLAEYSGAPLGIYKLSHAIKMLTLTSLFVALFLGGIGTGVENLVAAVGLTGAAAAALSLILQVLILVLLCIVLTVLTISLVHAVTARLKIEQLFKYYWTVVTGLALISLVLAWYGF
ncbi:MAG: respiratory chain complex I subunit 1 family protein [Clostridia bacterium]